MAQSSTPVIASLDHLVLTVADIELTVRFFSKLGMQHIRFAAADGTTRHALCFGQQKINLHQAGREFDPKARTPMPGSADLCFLSETSVDTWLEHLRSNDIRVEEGPVRRSGAVGEILSIYLRDPDENLIEISNQIGK